MFIKDTKKVEDKKGKEKEKKIEYDDLVTGVKQPEYQNIDVQRLPSDLESKVSILGGEWVEHSEGIRTVE